MSKCEWNLPLHTIFKLYGIHFYNIHFSDKTQNSKLNNTKKKEVYERVDISSYVHYFTVK